MTAEARNKEGVLILTQYDLPDFKRNMNAYQRVYFGALHAKVTLLIRRKRVVSDELAARVRVHRAPVHNRVLFFAYAVLYAIRLRFEGYRFILTEPSGFGGVGFMAKLLAGYFWVMDVWDRPRWRTGYHEEGQRPKFTDRLVFWIMGHADMYLLSCLPRAAKDIRMAPEKCVQLYNAIDQKLVVEAPPDWPDDDPMLHAAYARSKYHWTMGLDMILQTAEILKQRNCPARIHLVGEVRKEDLASIKESPAAEYIISHGTVPIARADFFRKVIKVGVAAYKPYEDLSYIFPIKVLEHLSQGNPVISSRLPGLCAMVQHEYNGLLVEPGDPVSLADAIERLQRDRSLWRRLAANALISIRQFDVEAKNRLIFSAILSRGKERS